MNRQEIIDKLTTNMTIEAHKEFTKLKEKLNLKDDDFMIFVKGYCCGISAMANVIKDLE